MLIHTYLLGGGTQESIFNKASIDSDAQGLSTTGPEEVIQESYTHFLSQWEVTIAGPPSAPASHSGHSLALGFFIQISCSQILCSVFSRKVGMRWVENSPLFADCQRRMSCHVRHSLAALCVLGLDYSGQATVPVPRSLRPPREADKKVRGAGSGEGGARWAVSGGTRIG